MMDEPLSKDLELPRKGDSSIPVLARAGEGYPSFHPSREGALSFADGVEYDVAQFLI